MYKIDYSNFKETYRRRIFLIIFGLALIIGNMCFCFSGVIKKALMDSKVIANSVEKYKFQLNKSKTTYIAYYDVKGKEYVCLIDSEEPLSNQKLMIYYKNADPNDCISEIEAKVKQENGLTLIGLITIVIGTVGILVVKKEMKVVKWLANNGTLISNLPYEYISYYHRNRPWASNYEKLKVNYKTDYGETLTLLSEPKYYSYNKYLTHVRPEVVDLLIDTNDTRKYFIDYNIKEYLDEY
jgi:hypothetical protein